MTTAEDLINAPEFTVSELSSALKRTVEEADRPCAGARRDFRLSRGAFLRPLLFRGQDQSAKIEAVIWKAVHAGCGSRRRKASK